MKKVTPRLSREDWILAGFRALSAGGVVALRVEAVARELGATKGSFYWHFADPADWRAAMLTYWEDAGFRQIVAGLESVPHGLPRLQALVQIATVKGHDPSHGGIAAEPALRDWARYASDVAEVVTRVDAGRLAFVAACFEEMAFDAGSAALRARLFYAALLGFETLRSIPEDHASAMLLLTQAISGKPGA